MKTILKKYNLNKNRGHALVVLLFFMILAITVITASVALMIASSSSTTLFVSGNSAKTIAESGIENALVRLLRNPNYNGEVLTVNSGRARITVSGDETKTIISEGVLDDSVKKIEVTATFGNNMYSISSWKEIF